MPFQCGMTAEEAHDLIARLQAGDSRAVGFVMLQNGKHQPFESRVITQMGESQLEAAIKREKEWVRLHSTGATLASGGEGRGAACA
jgi:hypothetical protein